MRISLALESWCVLGGSIAGERGASFRSTCRPGLRKPGRPSRARASRALGRDFVEGDRAAGAPLGPGQYRYRDDGDVDRVAACLS